MTKKVEGALTVLSAEIRARVLDKDKIIIDNREWWHYKIHDGGKSGRITDGMDGVIVTHAGAQLTGHVCWPDVRNNSARVRSVVGPRGLKFLQSLMKQKGFEAIEELHIVSAWQIKILVAIGKWRNPDKLIPPAIRAVTGKKLVMEKWRLPDSEVVKQ